MKRNNVNKHNKLLELSFSVTCNICKRSALLGLLLNSIIFVFNTYAYLYVYSLLRTIVSRDFFVIFSLSISLHYCIIYSAIQPLKRHNPAKFLASKASCFFNINDKAWWSFFADTLIYAWKLNYSDHWVITERSMWTHFEGLSTKLLHGICRVTVI